MIVVDKLLIQDIARAKFIDRFFYYLLNSVGLDCAGEKYMSMNPLKWSIMTLLHVIWFLICYILIIPFIGVPCMLFDAYKMPKTYLNDEFCGVYVDHARLIRHLN